MTKDDLVYVGHMLDNANKAVDLMRDKGRHDFDNDEVLRLALVHLIQVIGEAARQVSLDFRLQHSQVPWQSIVGMRSKVVHDYMRIDEDLVWHTLTEELPTLIADLEKVLHRRTIDP